MRGFVDRITQVSLTRSWTRQLAIPEVAVSKSSYILLLRTSLIEKFYLFDRMLHFLVCSSLLTLRGRSDSFPLLESSSLREKRKCKSSFLSCLKVLLSI